MTSLSEEISYEQQRVDTIYRTLDETRSRYRERQRRVQAANLGGSPQNRSERDAFDAHYGDYASRLEQVEEKLVFGRLDYPDSVPHYIGRVGLRDAADTQVLIDWRAPAAEAFYQATPADSRGLLRRRHISTRLRKVVGVEDELLSTGASKLGDLQGEGALMAALSQARTTTMGDIVSTIQAEQDRVIRSATPEVLIVEGGPGTGKTAVALHRVAYLLYSRRDQLRNSGVLVVGPTPAFIHYIEKVLPALGETGVVYSTLGNLLPSTRTQHHDSLPAAALKGSLRFVEITRNMVQGLVRPPKSDQFVSVGSTRLCLQSTAVQAAIRQAEESGLPHNEAWEIYATNLVEVLTNQYVEGYGTEGNREWMRQEIRESRQVRRAVNLAWLPASSHWLLERFYASKAKMSRYFSDVEVELLYRPRGSDWTVEDIPILDELEELLGTHRGAEQARRDELRRRQLRRETELASQALSALGMQSGLVSAHQIAERSQEAVESLSLATRARGDREWAYGHVVVDEAQELSALAWRMLLRRCPSRSFTVVGDLAQQSGPQGHSSWRQHLGPLSRANIERHVLTISYRTPGRIISLANRVLAANSVVNPTSVTSARDLPQCLEISRVEDLCTALPEVVRAELDILDRENGLGQGRLAIIAAAKLHRLIHAAQLPDCDADSCRTTVLSPERSKGLEFDAVVVLEPRDILESGPGDLYVALTRCTKRLRILHTFDLPRGFSN